MNEHPLNALPQGYRLQEYEFVRVLGFGGFGVTYLGFDHNLDMAVAIKEFQPADIATRTENQSIAPKANTLREDFDWGLERFLDEARTLARFDHRNIVKVHRYFEANGTAYIVMEYAEGETLSALLARKGTLDEAELKAILIPILDGLETVHGADFLHRDIKPGNIVLRDEDASPVLVDFGSARHAVSARSQSVTTIVTPGYAPIEQYSSRGYQGPWTDIYALGAVCYKALTGETPVDAIDRLENDPLEPVANRCAGKGGREFLKAIDSALNVKEGGRPQTITSWKTAVMSAGPTPQKVLPLPKSDLQPHSKQRKLSRFDFVVVILFLAVVIFGIGIAIHQEIEQNDEEARRVAFEVAAEEASQAAVEAELQSRAAAESRRAAEEAQRVRQARADEEARRAAAEAERQRQARRDTSSSYFTAGSHVDDVIRLQGTPRNIIGSVTSGTLYFGRSSVAISGSKVRSWSNSGNLKVRLVPGSNTSASTYFTAGSHVDDVIRLQGTPRNIIGSVTSGTLYFGRSSVAISGSKVRSWSNSGNLKVRLVPGSNTSASTYFTAGSHVDDVIRLQGTPRNIIGSVTSGTLYFGRSSVAISGSKVRSWSNSGNLKVKLVPSR